MIKESWSNKVKAVEVCTDKECFAKKNQEAEKAKEKKELEEFKKKIEKYKAKAAKAKMDRSFYILALADKLGRDYYGDQEGLEEAIKLAYGIKNDEVFRSEKKIAYRRDSKRYIKEI